MSDGENTETNQDQTDANDEGHFVARCRGLPWSTTVDEIKNFFSNCKFKEGESVHLTVTREGRPSGEAYIELDTEEDLEEALKKDRESMGKRYVEVFKSKYSEMQWVIQRNQQHQEEDQDGGENVVRLRGLPFDSTKDDIEKFFDGLEVTNNGILLTTDYQGRSSGEAFVQFTTKEYVEKALEKNKECIGHRYIEIFRSSMLEAFRNQHGGGGGRGGYGPRGYGMMGPRGRPGPYDRMGNMGGYGRGYGPGGPRGSRNFKGPGGDYGYGGGGYGMGYGGGMGMGGGGGMGGAMGGNLAGKSGHMIRMRGLPFRVTETDICEWFSSVTDPIGINIRYNNQGRPAGEADVLFATEAEAKKAMSKDRQNMQHRYVELFYDGPYGNPPPGTGGDAGGWGQGMPSGSGGSMPGGGMGGNHGMPGGNAGGMGMGGAGGMNSVGFPSQMSGGNNRDYGGY